MRDYSEEAKKSAAKILEQPWDHSQFVTLTLACRKIIEHSSGVLTTYSMIYHAYPAFQELAKELIEKHIEFNLRLSELAELGMHTGDKH